MDYTLKVSIVLLIFLYAWIYQEQNQTWDLTRNVLKDANNFATHDAALQIDDQEKSRGRLILDPIQAREIYEETLRQNLNLDAALAPRPGSLLRSPVRIVHFEILDQRNTVFPLFYTNTEYHIAQWIYGPAVVAVLETDYPQLIRKYPKPPMRIPAIGEYKENR